MAGWYGYASKGSSAYSYRGEVLCLGDRSEVGIAAQFYAADGTEIVSHADRRFCGAARAREVSVGGGVSVSLPPAQIRSVLCARAADQFVPAQTSLRDA